MTVESPAVRARRLEHERQLERVGIGTPLLPPHKHVWREVIDARPEHHYHGVMERCDCGEFRGEIEL